MRRFSAPEERPVYRNLFLHASGFKVQRTGMFHLAASQ